MRELGQVSNLNYEALYEDIKKKNDELEAENRFLRNEIEFVVNERNTLRAQMQVVNMIFGNGE